MAAQYGAKAQRAVGDPAATSVNSEAPCRRAGPGPQRARRWLISRCPVLTVAYRARSMAPIGVQLVKDVLSLVDGIGWPARVSWRLGHFSPGAVMPAGSDSWLRLALAP